MLANPCTWDRGQLRRVHSYCICGQQCLFFQFPNRARVASMSILFSILDSGQLSGVHFSFEGNLQCDFVCLVGVINQTKNGYYVKVLPLKPWKTPSMCPQTTCQNQESFATLCPFTNAFSNFLMTKNQPKCYDKNTSAKCNKKNRWDKNKTLLGLIYFGCHGSYYMWLG